MKRGIRMFQYYLAAVVLLAAAERVFAQLPGPFEFSFATGFLNNVFLFPFRLGGCG